MLDDFFKGFKISLGIIFGLGLFLGIVYAVGFHTADEILSGSFQGTYNFSNATVIGLDSIPSGAIMAFNLTNCPTGWSNTTNSEGRYIVGMPNGGTLGVTVGTVLSDQENRPTGNHRHSQTIYASGSGQIISGAGTTTTNAEGGVNARTIQTGTLASIPDETNAPYIQYLYCIKN